MILHELTGIKHLYHTTKWDILSMLEQYGIKVIGTGQYGEVLSHPSWNYVIKIFSDDCFLSFVHFAITHPNKHYPKMLRKPLNMHAFYKRGRSDRSMFWVVKIEKLYPITDPKLLKFIVFNLEHGADQVSRKTDYYNKWAKLYGPNGEEYRHLEGKGIEGSVWTQLFNAYPWFKTLCQAYAATWEHLNGSPDVHGGNFMQRLNGDIVIIDPVWEGETPYQAYDKWIRAESDIEHDEEDDITGPAYLKKIDKLKDLVDKSVSIMDDDIPF